MTAWTDIQERITGEFIDETKFNELVTNDKNIAERIATQESNYSLSAVPKGTICLWYGTYASLTALTGWQWCNGTNGLPDLRNAFVMGASEDADIGVTGGQSSHYHANGTGVTGAAGGHSHTGDTDVTNFPSHTYRASNAGVVEAAHSTHSHWITSPSFDSEADHTHALYGTGTTAALPPYKKLYWIGKL
jgi:hypothetical protein